MGNKEQFPPQTIELPLSIPYLLITQTSSPAIIGATSPPLLCCQTGFILVFFFCLPAFLSQLFKLKNPTGILFFFKKVKNIPRGSSAWQNLCLNRKIFFFFSGLKPGTFHFSEQTEGTQTEMFVLFCSRSALKFFWRDLF